MCCKSVETDSNISAGETQFHTDHESPSHQESINVRLDSLRIKFFSNHSKMFYGSVTKQGRNSYEYSQDLAEISQNRHDSVTNFLRCAITYLDILQ